MITIFLKLSSLCFALRVVTLAPSLHEMALALLHHPLTPLENNIELIGKSFVRPTQNVKGDDLPDVGPFHRLSLEKIISLKPDLTIGSIGANSKDQILKLRSLGLRVEVVNEMRLSNIPKSLESIGEWLNLSKSAHFLANQFQKDYATLMSLSSKSPKRKKIVIQVGENPLVVAGRDSYLNEIAALAGYQNIYQDIRRSYFTPSREDVVSRNPDQVWIMVMNDKMGTPSRDGLDPFFISKYRLISDSRLLRPNLHILEAVKILDPHEIQN